MVTVIAPDHKAFFPGGGGSIGGGVGPLRFHQPGFDSEVPRGFGTFFYLGIFFLGGGFFFSKRH